MTPAARLRGVAVVERGAVLLDDVDLTVAPGEHTVVLGPNGAGKTTLLRVIAGRRFPTRGTVEVLGARLGRVDLRTLRPRIGVVSTALEPLLQARLPAELLVAAARHGATGVVPGLGEDRPALDAAVAALSRVGAERLVGRRCDTLSQGEWQRVQIARGLATAPELLLLDEPMAGLDLGGRESLLADLSALMSEPGGPTVVLVTHHLEEVPPETRRAVLLATGRVVAEGPVDVALRDETLRAAFGLPITVERRGGRLVGRLA